MTTSFRSHFEDLFDDAAMFPPGNMPLEQAVPAHASHLTGVHAAMVGPFVLAADQLDPLARLVHDWPAGSLPLTITGPLTQARAALATAEHLPAVRPAALEVSLAAEMDPGDLVGRLRDELGGEPEQTVFVEVPRDARRDDVLSALAGTEFLAKFRTGGVRADLHPSDAELAASVVSAVRLGVAFKATAGLHHALRNTDPATGHEQHGFLNLMLATDAALDGAGEADLVDLLADRDADRIAARFRSLRPGVRGTFRSLGTCSIAEPIEELVDLGLLETRLMEDLA